MQQGSSAFSMTKTTKVWRKEHVFRLKSIYWVEEAWARPVSPTDQWPPCNHFLLSKFLKCWMILLKYLLYLLIFWIFTNALRKLTQNDEIKTQNSEKQRGNYLRKIFQSNSKFSSTKNLGNLQQPLSAPLSIQVLANSMTSVPLSRLGWLVRGCGAALLFGADSELRRTI